MFGFKFAHSVCSCFISPLISSPAGVGHFPFLHMPTPARSPSMQNRNNWHSINSANHRKAVRPAQPQPHVISLPRGFRLLPRISDYGSNVRFCCCYTMPLISCTFINTPNQKLETPKFEIGGPLPRIEMQIGSLQFSLVCKGGEF